MERRTVTLNLRIRPSTKAAAERLAQEDGRSLTSLIEKLIADAAKAAARRKA